MDLVARSRRLSRWRFAMTRRDFLTYHWANENASLTRGEKPVPESEICITNLPPTISENVIMHHFKEMGSIYKMRLFLTPNDGTAYVTFASPRKARLARSLHNSEICPGHKIRVRILSDKIFLGGIPVHVNKEQVLKELAVAGFENISEIFMFQSSHDEKINNRGFVILKFLNVESSEIARLQFEQCLLFGQRVDNGLLKPTQGPPDSEMEKMKILSIKNISIYENKKILMEILKNVLLFYYESIVKIDHFNDYAFVYFLTRQCAETAMDMLKGYYKSVNSPIEIEWLKPFPIENKETEGVLCNETKNTAYSLLNPNAKGVGFEIPSTSDSSVQENLDNMSACAVIQRYNFPQNKGFQG